MLKTFDIYLILFKVYINRLLVSETDRVEEAGLGWTTI